MIKCVVGTFVSHLKTHKGFEFESHLTEVLNAERVVLFFFYSLFLARA